MKWESWHRWLWCWRTKTTKCCRLCWQFDTAPLVTGNWVIPFSPEQHGRLLAHDICPLHLLKIYVYWLKFKCIPKDPATNKSPQGELSLTAELRHYQNQCCGRSQIHISVIRLQWAINTQYFVEIWYGKYAYLYVDATSVPIKLRKHWKHKHCLSQRHQ